MVGRRKRPYVIDTDAAWLWRLIRWVQYHHFHGLPPNWYPFFYPQSRNALDGTHLCRGFLLGLGPWMNCHVSPLSEVSCRKYFSFSICESEPPLTTVEKVSISTMQSVRQRWRKNSYPLKLLKSFGSSLLLFEATTERRFRRMGSIMVRGSDHVCIGIFRADLLKMMVIVSVTGNLVCVLFTLASTWMISK